MGDDRAGGIAEIAVGVGSAPITPAAPGTDTEPEWLELSIDSVTPNSVNITSDPTVSVTATKSGGDNYEDVTSAAKENS